jgi:endonuclease/exonuclease/phosphatase family metal-dependent hydrolase
MAAGVRLATFNLKDFFQPRTAEEGAVVDAKVANAAASLRRAAADVVALQEVGSEALVRRLVADVPELGYGVPVVGSADRRGIRNVILSRLPIQWSQVHESKSLPFPAFADGDPEPFPGRIPLRRGVVHVRVEVSDMGEVDEIDVITAHFKSGLPTRRKTAAGEEIPDATLHAAAESAVRSLLQRAAEALFVRGLVDQVLANLPDHAICVMGDLNDALWSLPVRLVRGLDPTSRAHLRSCIDVVPEDQRFSVFHGARRSLIDHILVSGRLYDTLRSCEIHNEALRDHGPPPGEGDLPLTPDSDHALSVAAFRPE